MLESRDLLIEQTERDVMACIGCNDCMLACPLPHAEMVTIAELNAAVNQKVIENPNVIQFVLACTQCRQCVPACPADLSRADIVLWNKMKVEDRVPNYTLMLQVGAQVYPSPWTLDDLTAHLSQVALFAGTRPEDLRSLLLKVTLRQLAPGEVVCNEGEFYERLCVLLHGSLEQSAITAGGARTHVLYLGPGSFFGEMCIMADQPEAYTVHALEPTIVVEMPKAAVLRLANVSAPFKATIEELYRRRALWTYARNPAALGGLPEQAVQEIFASAELKTFKTGETIVKEGTTPRDVYLVKTGFLRVSRNVWQGRDRALSYFREGDLFGALALLMNERTQPFTVLATSRSEVICIPGPHLFQVLSRYPGARERLQGSAMELERVARSTAFGPPPPEAPKDATRVAFSADVLVEKGLAKGTEVLVIDTSKCVNCQNCVDACGRRHTYSRLQLRGLQVENLLFPSACRHCEDPVCLLCSVNGIVRLPSGEITIVEDNCIGCGACAERCPYGNISMHAVTPPKQSFATRLIDFLKGGNEKSRALAELDPGVARKAVKCDLCAGYDDYACVNACPVGAAFRIDPMKAFEDEHMVVGYEMKRGGTG